MQKYKLIRTSNENNPEKRSTQFDELTDLNSSSFTKLGYMMELSGLDHIATKTLVIGEKRLKVKVIPFESE
jgi:hypothetical protein